MQDLSFIGAAILSIAGRPRPDQFGLRRTRLWQAIGWMAVSAFFAFYVFTLIWVSILGVDTDDSKLPDELGVDDSTFALVAVAVLVCGGRAVRRGVLLPGLLLHRARSWRAVAGGDPHRARLRRDPRGISAPAAFWSCWPSRDGGSLLYYWTGSLYPCIAAPRVNNSLAFGVSQDWGWSYVRGASLSILALAALAVRAVWTPAPAPAG